MEMLSKLFTFILVFALTTCTLNAQPVACDQSCDCPAYEQSISSAHWSVYIPIGVMVAAVVFFGICDGNDGSDSSNSKDGLGSIRKKAGAHSCSSVSCPSCPSRSSSSHHYH